MLVVFTLSGCSTISQTVAKAADTVKTEVQTAQDENFRIKRVRKALAFGDIIGAEEHRDTLYAAHWRCIANIEIAEAKYKSNKSEALKIVKDMTEEISNILDADCRATVLLSLLHFELETKKDITEAKETIEQVEQTIAMILNNDYQKMRRKSELQALLETHKHLLNR